MADGPGAFGSPVKILHGGGRISYSTPEGVPVAEAWVTEDSEPKSVEDQWFEFSVREHYEDAMKILLSKHRDYGPKNIADAPGGPLNGLRVRLHDKFARINHLIDSGVAPENESLRDSFLDAMNYCAIALLVIDGQWPGVEGLG